MFIAIVAISCKKEEKLNTTPSSSSITENQQFVRIDSSIFPKDEILYIKYKVKDNGAYNSAIIELGTRLMAITSNSNDSTLNIELPKRIYVEGDEINTVSDTTFVILLNQFIKEGNETVFNIGNYKIFKPEQMVLNNHMQKVVYFEYKSNEFAPNRKIAGLISREL